MKLSIMTYNTALQDTNIKNDEEDISNMIAYIRSFFQMNVNAVTVLQEIPYLYKDKESGEWTEDPVYFSLFKAFAEYAVFANSNWNDGYIRMLTMIITNIENTTALTLPEHPDHPLNRECAVVVPCDGTNIVSGYRF